MVKITSFFLPAGPWPLSLGYPTRQLFYKKRADRGFAKDEKDQHPKREIKKVGQASEVDEKEFKKNCKRGPG